MKLTFEGHSPLTIDPGYPCVLQIEPSGLFAKVAESLFSCEGRYAGESYTLWDLVDGEWVECNPRNSLLYIPNPFDLPWMEKCLGGEVLKRVEVDFVNDEEFRHHFEELERGISSRIMSLSDPYSADYSLAVEWDMTKLLKMLGFGIDADPSAKLIDNLISFLSLALDSRLEKVIVFVNLKTFLTENEVQRLYEHCFFTKRKVILLENKRDDNKYEYERKTVVDLDFL